MKLAEYYEQHGTIGLTRLAEQVGTHLSYLRQLIYTPHKSPSLKMAIAIVKASNGEISYEELAGGERPVETAKAA